MGKRIFTVHGMHCASCAATVEKAAKKIPGVQSAYVNFGAGELSLEADPENVPDSAVAAAVKGSGYEAVPRTEAAVEEAREEADFRSEGRRLTVALVFSVLLWGGAMFPLFSAASDNAMLQIVLLIPIIAVSGGRFYRGGLGALLRGAPNMDSLIGVGTGGAIVYSCIELLRHDPGHLYFDTAGMIIGLIMLGKYLELRSRRRASGAIRELMNLVPEKAILVTPEGDREIRAEEIKKGDHLRVLPGSRVPADGVVFSGDTGMDESMLTGESLPVSKTEGDPVTGGAINLDGSIVMEARRIGRDSTLARIVELVRQAQGSRAPIARIADEVSGWFVWAVLAIAAITFTAWALAGAGVPAALGFSLAVLVIACPCALGLATPIALIAGIGQGAKFGLLIKNGAVLESAEKISLVVFDKTGTLTTGTPEIKEISIFDSGFGTTEDELLRMAASAESRSEHPLGKAVVRAARRKGLQEIEPEEFRARPGFGIVCRLDQKEWQFGNRRMFQNASIPLPAETDAMPGSLIYAVKENILIGRIRVGDTVKPEAKAVVAELHAEGIRCAMLTGDNQTTAMILAKELELDDFYAELLPEEKSARLLEWKKKLPPGNMTAMVGDGVNDAPVLAAADVGVALGSGTASAMAAADVVLPTGNLHSVAAAIRLSRATMRIIRQNLFWAFFYNLCGIPVAAGVFYAIFGWGKLSPVFGAAAMGASSVSVVLNALRLRRFRP